MLCVVIMQMPFHNKVTLFKKNECEIRDKDITFKICEIRYLTRAQPSITITVL